MPSDDDAVAARGRGGIRQSAASDDLRAVLFDFSGTLFRLDEDDSWFDGMGLDAPARAAVLDRLTHPTAETTHPAWPQRDLKPELHRQAYLHLLRAAGLSDRHAEALYGHVTDPAAWTPYPDTAAVLAALRDRAVPTAVVSNIAWDVRPSFAALGCHPDEYVLSFEVGAVKPDPRIFETALSRLGVAGRQTLMIGDSEENDGGARALGCAFGLVDPLPTALRPTGLADVLAGAGLAL